jgi:iron complex outermembrane receptor protein
MKTLTIASPLVVAALLCGPSATFAQQVDLSTAGLEDLMKVEVTSVSKKEEQLFRAPSAIYVLTRSDIRRSGAMSIPDLLRLVPGLSVAQIDSSEWAVTSRGFNNLLSNKLLVLVDGRSVYNPVFSGVYWDIQTLPLEDIDRIEVIRGPGATVWGANAVNGVINIISRETSDTQGGYVTSGGGSLEQGFGSLRYGGRLGTKSYYRVYGRYSDHGQTKTAGSSSNAGDRWRLAQGGFRADLKLSPADSLLLSGNVSSATIGQISVQPIAVNSNELTSVPTNAIARSAVSSWTHKRSPRSSMTLTASFSEGRRQSSWLTAQYSTGDIDFQHRFSPARRHDLVWGVGQRFWTDREDGTFMVSFTPNHDRGFLTNAFIQDEMTIGPRLNLTVGSKLEHDSVSGFNLQPNARLSWTPTSAQNIWAAVSRAVRAPSRVDLNIRVNYATFQGPSDLPIVLSTFGNPAFRPEHETAYEVGYRTVLPSRIQVDTTAFYSIYHDLRRNVPFTFVETAPGPPHLVVASRFENDARATTSGVETAARWTLLPSWRLDAAYSWFTADFGANDAGNQKNAASPAHQWRFASGNNLPWSLRFDLNVFRVGSLAAFSIPAYTRVDERLYHQFSPQLSLGIVGQNLLDARHQEFGTTVGAIAREIPRSAYLRLTWQF